MEVGPFEALVSPFRHVSWQTLEIIVTLTKNAPGFVDPSVFSVVRNIIQGWTVSRSHATPLLDETSRISIHRGDYDKHH